MTRQKEGRWGWEMGSGRRERERKGGKSDGPSSDACPLAVFR